MTVIVVHNIKSLFGWNDKREKENNRSGSNAAEDDENTEIDKFEKYGISQDEICRRYVNTNGREKDKAKHWNRGDVQTKRRKDPKELAQTEKDDQETTIWCSNVILQQNDKNVCEDFLRFLRHLRQDVSDFDNYQSLLNFDICDSRIRCFSDNGIEHYIANQLTYAVFHDLSIYNMHLSFNRTDSANNALASKPQHGNVVTPLAIDDTPMYSNGNSNVITPKYSSASTIGTGRGSGQQARQGRQQYRQHKHRQRTGSLVKLLGHVQHHNLVKNHQFYYIVVQEVHVQEY